jgi:2-hydroxychromene-2-carboxylate isomerase
MPRLVCAVDFKSSESYLTFNSRGAAHAVPLDYSDVDFLVAEWETIAGDLAHPVERTPITARSRAHKIQNYERQRALQGLAARPDVFGDDARSTKVLLAGLKVVRMDSPKDTLRYAGLAFEAYVNQTVDVTEVAVVEGLVNKACGAEFPSGQIAKLLAETTGLIRATDLIDHSKTHVAPPTFIVGSVSSFDFLGLNVARLQLQAHGSKPLRPDVTPDVTLLNTSVSPHTVGMPDGPNSTDLIRTYRSNSATNTRSPTAALLDLYLDIKSPHAYLAVDMARQLESDFDVTLRCLPFDIELSKIYGEERAPPKPKPGSKIPPPTSFNASTAATLPDVSGKRSDAQKLWVRAVYADLRAMASLRGITVFGQEKVWNSRLTNLAMLFTLERGGREAQDRFIDEAYERTWRREFNLESEEAVSELVGRCLPGVHGAEDRFKEYCSASGKGQAALDAVLKVAHKRGIWGVPAFWYEGELFWGKEQIVVLRKRLFDAGRALRSHVVVDVPYLWRPAGEVKGKL